MATTLWAIMLLLVMPLTIHANYGLDIGVCYGLNGNNLPSPKDVVKMYHQYGIPKMRIYEANRDVLKALRGSGIALTLGTRNQDIPSLASGEEGATSWFINNVQPYVNDVNIQYITVGNEVVPGEFSDGILPAMQNLQNVLSNNNLGTKVTTVLSAEVLANSFPPSATTFTETAGPIMRGILKFLSSQKSPLLVALYPYFAYASDPVNVRLDYALFNTSEPVVQDGDLSYKNLLDAMIDSFYWAMEKEGVSDVSLVVSESGWPHDGNGDLTTPTLAHIYNRNFLLHVNGSPTPKRPSIFIEGFIFAMFDEDLKPPGVEQHWGIFNPTTLQPNYGLNN